MRNLVILISIVATGIISCGKKVVPESGANNSSRPVGDKTGNNEPGSANSNASSNTTPTFNNMQQSVPPPADGPRTVSMDKGKSVYISKCGSCHALKNPGDYTLTQVYDFLKIEIPRAKLDAKEAEQVTAYLVANAKK